MTIKMKKIYLSPATDIYNVNLRDGFLQSASQMGDKSQYAGGSSSDWFDGSEDNRGLNYDEGAGSEDLSRTSNGGNVWDNAW